MPSAKSYTQGASVLLFLTAFGFGCSTLRVNEKESRELSTNSAYDEAIKVEEAPVVLAAPAIELSSQNKKDVQVQSSSGDAQSAQTLSTHAQKKLSSSKKAPKGDVPSTSGPSVGATSSSAVPSVKVMAVDKKVENALTNSGASAPVLKPKVHEPAQLEDGEGFDGRRPIHDPYRVGEKVTYAVRYWKVDAGTMSLETLAPKYVNQKLSYHHHLEVKSRDSFNWIYSVNDKADLFLDFENLIPYSYVIKVDETNQVGENRCLFDWPNMNAKLWEKLKKKDKGIEEKVFDWKLEPFSQNVLSLPVYLRSFKLTPGKKFSIPFGHRGSNMLFGVNVLRRETLETDAGTFQAVVIRPTLKIDGAFKPMGEVLLWFSDDEQKLLLKIEAEIKIGTIRAEAIQVQRGSAPIAALIPVTTPAAGSVTAPSKTGQSKSADSKPLSSKSATTTKDSAKPKMKSESKVRKSQ